MGINQRPAAGISALREFIMVGEAGFSTLQGERVNSLSVQGSANPAAAPDS